MSWGVLFLTSIIKPTHEHEVGVDEDDGFIRREKQVVSAANPFLNLTKSMLSPMPYLPRKQSDKK
jgi:hypothetical protein